MKIVKLIPLTLLGGHYYWDADDYQVILPDGSIAKRKTIGYVFVEEDGIYEENCHAGSGFGKKRIEEGNRHKERYLLISSQDYDKVEIVEETEKAKEIRQRIEAEIKGN